MSALDFWADDDGAVYPVPAMGRRLKFASSPAHAKLRAFVFRRDGFTCVRCAWKPGDLPAVYDGRRTLGVTIIPATKPWKKSALTYLEVDHRISRSHGGSNHPDNLQTLCKRCNAGKQGRPMTTVKRRLA